MFHIVNKLSESKRKLNEDSDKKMTLRSEYT